MSAPMTHKEFVAHSRSAANAALAGLTDFQRMHYALSLVVEVNNPEAIAYLRTMAASVISGCDILLREMDERTGAPKTGEAA